MIVLKRFGAMPFAVRPSTLAEAGRTTNAPHPISSRATFFCPLGE
jgi:hypothetical protein